MVKKVKGFGMFQWLPAPCADGTCDHEPGGCVYSRSRRCLSGECTHATQGLHCGEAAPRQVAE